MGRRLALVFSFSLFSGLIFPPAEIYAECLALVKGAVAFDVKTCRAVDPVKDLVDVAQEEFFKGMTKSDRARFMQQYQGSLARGQVANSKAVREGLSPEKGALNGELVTVFLRADGPKCETINGKRLAGVIEEVCCDGGAEAPCLLSTSYMLQQVSVLGDPKLVTGDRKREVMRRSEDYKKALDAYKLKDYKAAAKSFEKVRGAGELDIAGHYWLGMTYRTLDMCGAAFGPLKHIVEENQKGQVWGDQLHYVRKANYLLARCYAKTNRPGEAAIILNSYLIEPKRYREEITGSIKHPDFGWINATKEYQDYKEKAKKAMGK